jgi:BirA family biotin operon repressor/biotin-[acetyl-CoA-carboxylase] ligase
VDEHGPFPRAWPRGWHVRHVVDTGSTNADLVAAVATGAPSRTVLFTDHQSAGRGRLDRTWTAPPGSNLLVSFLFRDGDPPGAPVDLMRRIGLAAIDAVARVAGLEAHLKWPNDVLVGGAKLAGLLAQRADAATVVGLGLNVGWAPEGAARLGERYNPADVLTALLDAFDRLPGDVGDLHDLYVDRLATLGQEVRVELPAGEPLIGRALGVEPDGRLVVLDACAVTHRIDAGDVLHLRAI